MKTRLIILMMTVLCLAAVAQRLFADKTAEAAEQAVNSTRQFINVEGADLRSKVEAATRLARSRSQSSPFWVAYSFDVRPGIAVDANVNNFNGSITTHGDTSILLGTSNGVAIETRNLAVFALVQPADNSVTRIEIYNLDRPREYSGYSVYWAGRATNQESLDYLKSLAESGATSRVAENAAMAIGLHDAAQVATILKDLIRKSSVKDVRETSVFWLGFIGGEQTFLAGIVRNEQEHGDVREAAAAAIGRSRDAAALALLVELYGQVANRDVKEQIINSIGKNDDQKAATAFLAKVAKTDADRELREAAIHRLGKLPGTHAFLADVVRNEQEVADVREAAVHAMGKSEDAKALTTLQSLYKSVSNKDVREAIIHAVTKHQNQQEAMSFLVEVAKSDPSGDMRETAVQRLGRMAGTHSLLLEIARNESEIEDVRQAAVNAIAKSGDAAALTTLQTLYAATSNEGVKEQILNSIAKNQDQDAALAFVIKVAESDSDRELREQAVSRLSKFASAQSFEALKRIAINSSADADLQEQAVHAISKRPADESVPALIEIAKTHPRQEVRETAIRRLSKTSDERAKEFLKQLLSN